MSDNTPRIAELTQRMSKVEAFAEEILTDKQQVFYKDIEVIILVLNYIFTVQIIDFDRHINRNREALGEMKRRSLINGKTCYIYILYVYIYIYIYYIC